MLIPLIAFAGLTCSFAVRPIGLWSMDDYLWHLMNSVPLLHVTDALNWAEPKTHAGTILSLLLVIYQIAVILPFLGLGVAAVRVVSKNLPNVAKYWRELGGDEDRPPLAVSLILIGGSAVFWYISILILGLTVPSDSPLQRYLDRRLAEHMHILSHSVSLHWLHETIQVGVAVLLLIGGLALATITLAVESLLPLETVWSKARASYVAVLALVVLMSATLVSSFAAAGASRLAHGQLSRAPFRSFVNVALWHDAHTLPGIDLPDDLGWTPAVDLTDRWSGIVFLLQLCISLVVVTIPIALLLKGARRS